MLKSAKKKQKPKILKIKLDKNFEEKVQSKKITW